MRDFRDQPLSDPATAAHACHVGLRPGLVDEHQAADIDILLSLLPLLTPTRNVGAILFAGVKAFF